MRKFIAVTALLFAAQLFMATASRADGVDWKEWSFLLGNWRGASDGIPGASQTLFSFDLDRDHHVIVRHDHSDYVHYQGIPQFSEDGQLFIYKDSSGQTLALATGDDGRTVTFTATAAADGNSWTFVSAPEVKRPQWRLTYDKINNDNLILWYDYALPGQPGNFQPYLHATGVRIR